MDAQTRVQMAAQDAASSTQKQVRESGNGTWRKFAEPRSWALKWDGFALARMGEQRNGHTPPATDEPR